MDLEPPAEPPKPLLPLGPGRQAFSKRVRTTIAVVLVAGVVGALGIGIAIAIRSPHSTPRVVTIPAADRKASAALLQAAEEVNFEPTSISGGGTAEDRPISSSDLPSDSSLLAPGTVAPPFTLLTPAGDTVDLAALRGKRVLLEFFATWCPHCAAEAPHLKKLYASLPNAKKDFAVVLVNADGETAPSVLAYHIYFDFPFPAVLDPNPAHPGTFHHAGSRGPISLAYKVPEYPTFYVLDAAGRVAWAAKGEKSDALLRRELLNASA